MDFLQIVLKKNKQYYETVRVGWLLLVRNQLTANVDFGVPHTCKQARTN
jgi:hypothetical protein